MKNKILSALLSVMIAFGLWLYVITVESPGSEETINDIPVSMVGENALHDRGLMLTAISSTSVDLTLSGTRTDLNEVNASNITLKVDLSKLYEAGKHRVEYSISYPGTVASNAFEIEQWNPRYITVTIEERIIKPVPVEIKWVGDRSDDHLYDFDNKVLDYSNITITGPKSVTDQITKAVIEVDLTGRTESFSQSYRYTLCDSEGNPVDAETILVDVEEVTLDLKIQRIKEVQLALDVTYGAGATDQNTTIDITPQTIRVSGSDAALEALGDRIVLGSIDMRTITEDLTQTYTITLPEGVTNETGTTEVQVSITLTGLMTKTFAVAQINAINTPADLETEIIPGEITVTVRGPLADINRLTAEDITVNVDLSNAELGTTTYRAAIVFAEGYDAVGAMGTYSILVTVSEPEEEVE